jgi:peptidoglycan/LPS O-acetylase OafA/YrhL
LSVGERVFFATYQSFLQGFFMALLFFVSAYFVPASYDRKGAVQYVWDRFVRLMVPTFLYVFAIGPLTEYYVSRSWTGGGGFAHQWLEHVTDGEWLSGTGPMWFCVVLFAFSLAYACVRLLKGRPWPEPPAAPGSVPSLLASLGFILTMAIGSFVVRIFVPSGKSVFNMQPADMPQYALMFAAGILAARGRWLEHPVQRPRVTLGVAALAASCAIWIVIVVFAAARPDEAAQLDGGMNLPSALKCIWEALVCVGMSYLLIALYRKYFNSQRRAARFLSDNAFAVYLFHPPILVFCAILIHEAGMPGPAKAVLLTGIAAMAAFAVSALVLRRIPYLRRVL